MKRLLINEEKKFILIFEHDYFTLSLDSHGSVWERSDIAQERAMILNIWKYCIKH